MIFVVFWYQPLACSGVQLPEMTVQRIKIWQWILISLVVWGIVGFFLITSEDLSGPGSINRTVFFRELQSTTEDGKPIINDLLISPAIQSANGWLVQRVTFKRLMKNRQTGEIEALPADTIAEIPFLKNQANPDNRIGDYLAELQKKIPDLKYGYAWWRVSGLQPDPKNPESGWEGWIRGGLPQDRELFWWQYPRGAWIVLGIICVSTIGLIWPMLIRWLVRLGFGQPEDPDDSDLRHVSTQSDSGPTNPSKITQADQEALEALNARLATGLGDLQITGSQDQETQPGRSGPVFAVSGNNIPSEPDPPVNNPNEPKEYVGEFYPVAKPKITKK